MGSASSWSTTKRVYGSTVGGYGGLAVERMFIRRANVRAGVFVDRIGETPAETQMVGKFIYGIASCRLDRQVEHRP